MAWTLVCAISQDRSNGEVYKVAKNKIAIFSMVFLYESWN